MSKRLTRLAWIASLALVLVESMPARAPADDSADAFIREMSRDRSTPYDVLGVIDEKGSVLV